MFQVFSKINEQHDQLRIVCQGDGDTTKYLRVFDYPASSAYRLAYRVEPFKDGEITRRSIVLFMEELPIEDISAQSSHFADLSLVELRTLAKTHAVQPEATDGKLTADGDKPALVAGLRKRFPVGYKSKAVEGPTVTKATGKRPPLVISDEIKSMSPADLETKAGVVGALTPNWARLTPLQQQQAVMAKMK